MVEGQDLSRVCLEPGFEVDTPALLSCAHPFGNWHFGREYRGLRTWTHTYVRDLQGPWMLFDNVADPLQLNNLCDDPAAADLRRQLDAALDDLLALRGDDFASGAEICARHGYVTDGHGIVVEHPTLPTAAAYRE